MGPIRVPEVVQRRGFDVARALTWHVRRERRKKRARFCQQRSLALKKLVVPVGLEKHAELMAACKSKGVELMVMHNSLPGVGGM